jgi:hypothetical protein
MTYLVLSVISYFMLPVYVGIYNALFLDGTFAAGYEATWDKPGLMFLCVVVAMALAMLIGLVIGIVKVLSE